MAWIKRLALGAVVVCCALALALRVFPGPLAHTNILVELVVVGGWLVAVGASFLVLLVITVRKRAPGFARWSALLAAGGIAAATLLLMVLNVPERVAFAMSRSAFEREVPMVPTWERGLYGEPANKRLGLFHVDRCAADPRGGVYFRVRSSSLLESTSEGFCFQPNPSGSPFGAAGYRTSSLGGGWHWFTANDDCY